MIINRLAREMVGMIKADDIVLGYLSCKAQENRVNLNSYSPAMHDESAMSNGRINNLGDHLSKIIVDYMCSRRGCDMNAETTLKRHLYAVGSIILMGYQNATIWGTGCPYEPSFLRGLPHRKPFRKLDIRCVRGPLTQKTLENLGHSCPQVYGDPAVLLPLMYKPLENEIDKKRDYVIISHYQTERGVKEDIPTDNFLSMNTTEYKAVIDKICSAEKVVSSSLHGIILAEAYGVPAVFFQDRPARFNYKYEDWYASTGREMKIPKIGWKAALDSEAYKIPELLEMQTMLINTFPYDLWED